MQLWIGDKKFGQGPPPPHSDKIQKNSSFSSWNRPWRANRVKIFYQPTKFWGYKVFRRWKVIRVSRESCNNTLTFDHQRKLANYKTNTKVVLKRGRSLRIKGTAKKIFFWPKFCEMWHMTQIYYCLLRLCWRPSLDAQRGGKLTTGIGIMTKSHCTWQLGRG